MLLNSGEKNLLNNSYLSISFNMLGKGPIRGGGVAKNAPHQIKKMKTQRKRGEKSEK